MCGHVRFKLEQVHDDNIRWNNYGDCKCRKEYATIKSIVYSLTPKIEELNQKYTEISKEKEEEQAKFNKQITEKDAEKDAIIHNFQKQLETEKENTKILKATNEKLNDQCNLLREQNEKVIQALLVLAREMGLFSGESQLCLEDLLNGSTKTCLPQEILE